MRYTSKNLLGDEKIVYEAKLHKYIFVWPIVWSIVFFGLGFFFLSMPSSQFEFALLCGVIFILLGILTVLNPLIQYKTSEYAITNKRIISKVGFISRRSTEIRLDKIESVELEQGIIGRIFDLGSIKITGTGGAYAEFKNIAKPIVLRNQIQNEIKIN